MPIVDAFLAIANQWDTTAFASGRLHWHGLDYARVQAGYALAGITVPPGVWMGVQRMERDAAKVLNGSAG